MPVVLVIMRYSLPLIVSAAIVSQGDHNYKRIVGYSMVCLYVRSLEKKTAMVRENLFYQCEANITNIRTIPMRPIFSRIKSALSCRSFQNIVDLFLPAPASQPSRL